jgi:ribosomal protein S18 acetylase RimI-like enzyme
MTVLDPSCIHIRPAQAGDKSLAAQIMYLSMDGLADYLFGCDACRIDASIAELFEQNAGRFGYKLALIAELEKQPVGMLVSYAGSDLNRLDIETAHHCFRVLGFKDALNFIVGAIRLPGGAEAQRDEYYLSNLGILPAAQGHGIGSYLLDYAEKLARARNLFKCSLIVGMHNVNAFRLYLRMGYQVVETVNDKNESLGYYRMVKNLN